MTLTPTDKMLSWIQLTKWVSQSPYLFLPCHVFWPFGGGYIPRFCINTYAYIYIYMNVSEKFRGILGCVDL